MAKSTDIEVDLRVSEVFKMLLRNISRGDIVQHASERWGITDRQTDTLIKRAKERILEILNKDQEEWVAVLINKQFELYEEAFSNNQLEVCRKVLTDIATLKQVNGADKIEITDKSEAQKAVKNTDTSKLLKILSKK